MPSKALVWFKRDLRVRDHAPLVMAADCDVAAAVFVIEPEWLQSPEFDAQHLDFAMQSLIPLRNELAARGLPLLVKAGSVLQVFESLRETFAFTHLLSHQETGQGWTYQRDLNVAGWCRLHSVIWREWAQTGVVRPLKTRLGWAAKWVARMNAPVLDVPRAFPGARLQAAEIPTIKALGVSHNRSLPKAGEDAALDLLHHFVNGGARGYRRTLSSPLTAEQGCSRLSAHLAFGTISMRSVHQATEQVIATTNDRELVYGLRGFAGRLRWHCHFMQKLEDEPAIEFNNFARACDGLRENEFNREFFESWCAGETGYPMVDACMRSLKANGWLNFRMRAMLVSFASYHLWLHWRETGIFLARQFLDFEPGIHWSQMQMQSGTTGINTLRIHSPSKQARDHDPHELFIRRWVPELGSPVYAKPIVDERSAVKSAKEKMYALRSTPESKREADAVQQRHGSRRSGLPRSGKRNSVPNTNDQQLKLF
jgi:deoxyribodipyrimidine photo-lyase